MFPEFWMLDPARTDHGPPNNGTSERQQQYHAYKSISSKERCVHLTKIAGFDQGVLVHKQRPDADDAGESKPVHPRHEIEQKQNDECLKVEEACDPESFFDAEPCRDRRRPCLRSYSKS